MDANNSEKVVASMNSASVAGEGQTTHARRRTPKQLERKRLLDREAVKVKRQKEKAWKLRVQTEIQSIQQHLDRLRDGSDDVSIGSHHQDRDIGIALRTLPVSPLILEPLGRNFRTGEGTTSTPQTINTPLVCHNSSATSLKVLPEPYFSHPSQQLEAREGFHEFLQPKTGMETELSLRSAILNVTPRTAASMNNSLPATYQRHLEHNGTELPESLGISYPATRISYTSSSPHASLLIEEEPQSLTVGCLCEPKVHSSYAICFELTVYTTLINMHRQPHYTIPTVPRDPPLSDLLFLGPGDNMISQTISKMFRRSGFRTLAFMFSAYLLVYRVLRFRCFPSLETFHDIPEWLHPTEIQDNTPHLIFTDFIHFPELRKAMILGSVEYVREVFEIDYIRHISMNWPDDRSLLLRSSSGSMVINPAFEPHISILDNWSMDTDFAMKYPLMAPLVNIRQF